MDGLPPVQQPQTVPAGPTMQDIRPKKLTVQDIAREATREQGQRKTPLKEARSQAMGLSIDGPQAAAQVPSSLKNQTPCCVPGRRCSTTDNVCDLAAPLLGLLLFTIGIVTCAALGFSARYAIVAGLVPGATVASLDTRKVSIELTALIVLFTLVVTNTLTFDEALAGAGMSSIWLVWVGGVAGAAFDACLLSDWVVSKAMRGARPNGEIGLLPLLARVGALTFVTSMAIPSAVSRNLFLVPLAKRFKKMGQLDAERTEAVAAALIFGATKPGMGLLTGYVTSMLVSDTYANVIADPALANSTAGAPAELAWATYAMVMLPVWGLLMGVMITLSVFVVYRPLVRAADDKRGDHRTMSTRKRRALRLWTGLSRTSLQELKMLATNVKYDVSLAGVTPFDSLMAPSRPSSPETSPTKLIGRRGGQSAFDGVDSNASTTLKAGPRLSPSGVRAIAYLLAAIFAWALLGGTLPGVHVDKGAVGIGLVMLLYAPRPVGVADVAELRTAKSYGAIIYLCSVIACQRAVTKVGLPFTPCANAYFPLSPR